MSDSKQRHLETNERVNECQRHVLCVGIRSHWMNQRRGIMRTKRRTMLDSAGGRKEGNRDTLPKRQEQDALDTKEFG